MPGSDGPGMGSPAIGNRVLARRRPRATAASTKRSSGAGPCITFRRTGRGHQLGHGACTGGVRERRRVRAARPSSHPDPAAARPDRQQEGCVPHAVNVPSLSSQPVRDAWAGLSVWPHCPAGRRSLQGDADRCCAQDDPAQQPVAARLPQHSAITPMTSWPGFSSGRARLKRARLVVGIVSVGRSGG